MGWYYLMIIAMLLILWAVLSFSIPDAQSMPW